MVQLVPLPWLAHGARKELAQQSSGHMGGFCVQIYAKGSRAVLPYINKLGTALKRGANGIAGQSSHLDVGHLLSEDQRQGGASGKKPHTQTPKKTTTNQKRVATVVGLAGKQPHVG